MIVNLETQNDADFVRAFVLCQSVDDWVATTFYATGALALYAGRVWSAVANSTGITPGTDATKWALGTAPKVNLTGASLLFMSRRNVASNTAEVSVSTDDGNITITDAVNGAFSLRLPFSQLSIAQAGNYTHSLIMTVGGVRSLLWHGAMAHSIGAAHV